MSPVFMTCCSTVITSRNHGLWDRDEQEVVVKRTHHRIVNVSDPTPFAIRGQNLQTTDGLAPEDCHTPNVCDYIRCSLGFLNCEDSVPVWPLSQTFLDFSSSSSVRL